MAKRGAREPAIPMDLVGWMEPPVELEGKQSVRFEFCPEGGKARQSFACILELDGDAREMRALMATLAAGHRLLVRLSGELRGREDHIRCVADRIVVIGLESRRAEGDEEVTAVGMAVD